MTIMTEKDKKLIPILAVAVILFLFLNYLILPMARQSRELERSIEEAEFEKMQMQQSMVAMSGREKELEQKKMQYEELAAGCYPRMNSQQIDREVTGMVKEAGLTALELEVEIVEEADALAPYQIDGSKRIMAGGSGTSGESVAEAQAGSSASGESVAESQAGSGASGGSGTKAQAAVSCGKVRIRAAGTEASCLALLDHWAKNCPAIRVAGFSIKDADEILEGEDGSTGKMTERTSGRLDETGEEETGKTDETAEGESGKEITAELELYMIGAAYGGI